MYSKYAIDAALTNPLRKFCLIERKISLLPILLKTKHLKT